jgi:hypothetical protein
VRSENTRGKRPKFLSTQVMEESVSCGDEQNDSLTAFKTPYEPRALSANLGFMPLQRSGRDSSHLNLVKESYRFDLTYMHIDNTL